MKKLIIDADLRGRIRRVLLKKSPKDNLITVCCGFNSSLLGDERGLREFLIGAEIEKWIKIKGYKTKLVLVLDSFDPVSFKQLRVALEKDDHLIKKFEKYCGSPPRLIPDPFSCHKNYAIHFQSKLLGRLQSLNVSPEVFDTYLAYEEGVYNTALALISTKHKKVTSFLKKEFPDYSLNKLFWPLCKNCKKMDKTSITRFGDKKIAYACERCKKTTENNWKKVDGKISWKVDHAFIWNLIQADIEPFYKSYLDPKAGSYFVAKAISQEFFGGKFPKPIMYGQVQIDRALQHKLLDTLPLELIRYTFLSKRRSDIKITKDKLVNLASKVKVAGNLTFLKYTKEIVPEVVLQKDGAVRSSLINKGLSFSKMILGKNLIPLPPTAKILSNMKPGDLATVKSILEFVIKQKLKKTDFEEFNVDLDTFLAKKTIRKSVAFPLIRTVIRYKAGLPMTKVFYYLPNDFVSKCICSIERYVN